MIVETIVAGLAGHRAARALSIDDITEAFREKVLNWSIDIDATDAQVKRRGYIADLIHCPHCAGFWLTGISLAALLLAERLGWRWLRWLVVAWAAASIQSTLSSAQMFLEVTPDSIDPDKEREDDDADEPEEPPTE